MPAPAPDQPLKLPALLRLRIALYRGLLVLWARCFSLTGLYRLGQVFGTLEYLCDYNRRRRVHAKLRELFKEEYTPAWGRKVAWRYFMRIRCDKYYYTIMDRIPREKVLKRIRMINRHFIDDALSEGNGVYVALCHYGSHHVAGLMMGLMGYELTGVRDAKESPVRRYIQQKYKETFPEIGRIRVMHANSFPRELYRRFQENGMVCSLLDADRRRGETTRTYPVTIFGEQRNFLTGPLQIALRCGARVVQGFVVSRPKFYYQLVVAPPLVEAGHRGDESETVAAVLQQYAHGVERFARERPDHLMNI